MGSARDDLAEIATLRNAMEVAENESDPEAAAAWLADDAVLMVPDFPVQEGKTACTAFLHDVMGWLRQHFHRRIAYVSQEVKVIHDVGFDRGTFAFTVAPRSGGDASHVTGKYFWLLSRTPHQGWKVARMIIARDDEASQTGHATSVQHHHS